jgi:predicted DNA-binding transcriptional regulator AlpA
MSTNMQLLTPEQLAKRWSVSAGTLANWRYKRTGPDYVRLGGGKGMVRYRLTDIERWEKENQNKLA